MPVSAHDLTQTVDVAPIRMLRFLFFWSNEFQDCFDTDTEQKVLERENFSARDKISDFLDG
jgi:hypothetical protein